mmetsp:Transcript_5675/g.16261  ORF Transcript_5675/g.16261 Transcript_5675/m.16261 type:complete len:224 (-) Transcript_5675:34-705(-)
MRSVVLEHVRNDRCDRSFPIRFEGTDNPGVGKVGNLKFVHGQEPARSQSAGGILQLGVRPQSLEQEGTLSPIGTVGGFKKGQGRIGCRSMVRTEKVLYAERWNVQRSEQGPRGILVGCALPGQRTCFCWYIYIYIYIYRTMLFPSGKGVPGLLGENPGNGPDHAQCGKGLTDRPGVDVEGKGKGPLGIDAGTQDQGVYPHDVVEQSHQQTKRADRRELRPHPG